MSLKCNKDVYFIIQSSHQRVHRHFMLFITTRLWGFLQSGVLYYLCNRCSQRLLTLWLCRRYRVCHDLYENNSFIVHSVQHLAQVGLSLPSFRPTHATHPVHPVDAQSDIAARFSRVLRQSGSHPHRTPVSSVFGDARRKLPANAEFSSKSAGHNTHNDQRALIMGYPLHSSSFYRPLCTRLCSESAIAIACLRLRTIGPRFEP